MARHRKHSKHSKKHSKKHSLKLVGSKALEHKRHGRKK